MNKALNRFIAAAVALTALIACGGEDPIKPDPGPEAPKEITFDKNSYEAAAEGETVPFSISAPVRPKVTSNQKWITVKDGTYNKFRITVELKIEANEGKEPRTAEITVKSGDLTKVLTITQKAPADNTGGNDGPPVPNDGYAWTAARKLGIGWNLGNHFDAHNNGVSGETFWGNPKATEATFLKVKAAGFSTVRIPVTWLGQFGKAPEYKIDLAWMERVAEVVGYAEKAGLNVILNMHHDGADSKYWLNIKAAAASPAIHEQIMEQITAMWSQIAARFVDKGDFLIFEAFNEIHDGGWGWGSNRNDGGKQYKCLNEWNQAFVDAVRATGGNNATRYLGIPAYCTNPDLAIETWEMPKDKAKGRLMVSVHCYDPHEYTIPANKSEWGHTASAANKVAGDNEADLEKVFRKLYDHFFIRDTPVYLGEFGCVNRATSREQAFQQYYLKYFAKLSKMYGIPCLIWDNGAKGHGNEKHAFIDHATGEFCSDEAKAAIRAMVSSYKDNKTLEEVYNTAP